MNAQEALDELKRAYHDVESLFSNYDPTGLSEEVLMTIEPIIPVFQQFIDQANAKPKTLEELGWVEVEHNSIFGMTYTSYEKANQTIHFRQTERKVRVFDYYCGDIRPVDLTYEEILAIAEKMKELGMDK